MRPGTRLTRHTQGDQTVATRPARLSWLWRLPRPLAPGGSGGRPGAHRGSGPGGKTFALVTVLPALLVMAWLLAGLPLLLAGRFVPVATVLISVPVAAGLVIITARHQPGWWPAPGQERQAGSGGRAGGWLPWLGLAGTVAVAAAFGFWQATMNSPQLIVTRDPGAFLQFGYWIAEHGSLPIPPLTAAFGGVHPGLTFASASFPSHAGAVVPRLAAGLPITLAAGLWAHGLAGGLLVPPVLGALAVLTVGGLTGRLAGPQWAPAGAALLALTLPEVYTSRSAFSAVGVQLLLFGGLCLVVDSLGARKPWLLAAAGGCALGLTVLAEIGALAVLLPAILFVGVLLAARRPQGVWLAGGLLAGAGLGLTSAFVLTPPLASALAPQLRLTLLAAAGFVAVTLVAVALGLVPPVRSRSVRMLAARPLRWLPEACAVIVVLAAAGFAARPYLQVVRGNANQYLAALQRISQLPPDPGRLYAEDSLYWVVWYLGAPALLLGVAGLALLARRCLRALLTWQDPMGTARTWALPLLITGWGTAAVLWRPGTTPDQPWASRQLVPLLLPGLVVAAIWACAWLASRARARGAGAAVVTVAVVCFLAALAGPPVVTTFGIGAKNPPQSGLPPARGMAFQPVNAGQLAAVRALCGAIPGTSSVLLVDQAAASHFTQVIRGMCGVPAADLAGATAAQVRAALAGITRAGRGAVLLASNPAELASYQPAPRRVLSLAAIGDAHLLTQPPASGWPERYVLWMSGPGAVAGLGSGA